MLLHPGAERALQKDPREGQRLLLSGNNLKRFANDAAGRSRTTDRYLKIGLRLSFEFNLLDPRASWMN